MATLSDFELRTLPGIWRWYDQSAREMAFRADNPADAEVWQGRLRGIVTRALGGFPTEKCDLDPHFISSESADGFTRELVVIQTLPGEYMPVYVLIPPATAAPYKPVIALHGHGTWESKAIVGIPGSRPDHDNAAMQGGDYARQLALRGFLVFAPVQRGFGDRMETTPLPVDLADPESLYQCSCKQVSMDALMAGKTLAGLRVWDVMRLIDYIQTGRSEQMTSTLGCAGLSGGGTITLFATALDPRISCAVISGYFNTFKDSIMSIDHCTCNYVPGIVQYAEMVDIAALIAPRPLLVESASHDPIFPTSATKTALSELATAYRVFGAEYKLESDFFEGVHQWGGRKAYDWLNSWL